MLRWVIASDWAIRSDEVAQKDKPDFNVFGLLGLWLPDKADRTAVRLVLGSLVRTRKGINAAKIVAPGESQNDRHLGYTYLEFYINELADNLVP